MKGKPESDAVDMRRRQRMAPEERRARILDAAQDLFFSQGWDDVTIADVLDKAGISKGGFYHHFEAKEDLLDGIVERFTTEALAAAETARSTTTGDALARFNAFLAASSRWKAERAPQMKFFLGAMMRPGNDLLFQRIANASGAAVRPVLGAIIAEGVAEGGFDVTDTDIVTEMILALSDGRRLPIQRAIAAAEAGDLDTATVTLGQRLKAEGALIDRMLGLPRGSVVLSSDPSEHRAMLSAMVRD